LHDNTKSRGQALLPRAGFEDATSACAQSHAVYIT